MPNPVVGIVGSAIGGLISSGRAARATRDAADSTAEATAYSTDRQIEAAKEARDEAVKAAKEGNAIATGAQTTAARQRAAAETRGEVGARGALLKGNRGAANQIVKAAAGQMRSKVRGSKIAQNAVVRSNRQNNAFFKKILAAENNQLKSWRVAGRKALTAIGKGLKDGTFSMDTWKFEADPGFQFRQEQGERALERSAAARGGLLSGNQIAAAQEFNSGLAAQEYADAYARGRQERVDAYGRLLDVADRGQDAAESTAANFDRYGERVGQGRINIGNAIAAGAIDRAGYASDFLETSGETRALQAATRGNIIADSARTLGGIAGRRATDIGNVTAQGALNVANAAQTGATSVGTASANAWNNYAVGMGDAAAGRARAGAIGAQGFNDAVQGGIGNWLTYSMLNPQPAAPAAPAGAMPAGPGRWLAGLLGRTG